MNNPGFNIEDFWDAKLGSTAVPYVLNLRLNPKPVAVVWFTDWGPEPF